MKISKGTIFKKKNSPYLYINISIDKKRYFIKTSFTHDKENHVKSVELPLFKAKLLTGEITLKEEILNDKTFQHYSELFLNSKKYLKYSTYRRYELYLNRFNESFGSRLIKELKASDIKNYLYSLDIRPLTFRNYLNIFKCTFDEALLDEEIIKNPCVNIKVPKNVIQEIEPFSKDDVNKILSNSTGYFKNFLAFAFYTGCRTGELFALKWQNIDIENKRIYINATRNEHYGENSPKTGKNRYVPIFDTLLSFIESQRVLTGFKTYVFYTERGKLLNGANLTKKHWYPLLKRIGLPKRVIYNTRHTFATNMIVSNHFSINQVAYWLGHATIKTVMAHYNKFIKSDLENYDTNYDVFSSNKCNKSSRIA